MRKLKSLSWWIVGAAVTGCAPLGSGMYGAPPKPMVYAFDAVKRITPSISVEADPSTIRQAAYPLSREDHLLLRRQDMLAHASNVRTDDTYKVLVQVTVVGDAIAVQTAVDSASICPLSRHFMMFATWQAAHQFGSSGRWNHEGGDYDDTACVKGEAPATEKNVLQFDVTQWFIDYPRARGANFGLLLRSEKPVTIAGDTSGSGYPRLLWSE